MPTEPLKLDTGELKSKARLLHSGDRVLLSGTVYTARDAAHKRIVKLMSEHAKLPFNINGAAIYYAGPTGTPANRPIGSCGPTTSSRMDVFAPAMLDAGLSAMIGKGERNDLVCEAIKRNGAVYFCALGGAGALACRCIVSCDVIAFPELGCESVKKLTFCDFPLITAIDAHGGNIFKEGREKWRVL